MILNGVFQSGNQIVVEKREAYNEASFEEKAPPLSYQNPTRVLPRVGQLSQIRETQGVTASVSRAPEML